MQVKIMVSLSEAGQKAQILLGLDAGQYQTLMVERADPDFARVVAAGTIDRDEMVLDGRWKKYWDHVPTVTEVLEHLDQLAREDTRLQEQRQTERRAETLAVLTERRTTVNHLVALGGQEFPYHCADWPYPFDETILNSPAAQAWKAELAAEKAIAESACQTATAVEQSRREIAKAAAAAAEVQRRADLELATEELDLEIENGALEEVPANCWESHRRGKNWLAIIIPNPGSPGGLERVFVRKAHGSAYYLIEGINVGDAIEFGADYYSGGGRKNPIRWYGVVTRLTPTMLVVAKCATGKAACKRAAAMEKPPALEDEIESGIAHVNSEGSIESSNRSS